MTPDQMQAVYQRIKDTYRQADEAELKKMIVEVEELQAERDVERTFAAELVALKAELDAALIDLQYPLI